MESLVYPFAVIQNHCLKFGQYISAILLLEDQNMLLMQGIGSSDRFIILGKEMDIYMSKSHEGVPVRCGMLLGSRPKIDSRNSRQNIN